MAALRFLARSKLSAIILRLPCQLKPPSNVSPIPVQIQKRWSTYRSSPIYEDPSKYTDYEVTNDPQEWEYVERLLRPQIIPKPPLENQEYPSGWKPPTAKPGDYPYYINRTRNYMQPVYLKIQFRGMRKITKLCKIQGDIWALEAELKEYLSKNSVKPIGIRINELVGEMKFRGDYVSLVKRWMDSKGF
ncbi:PREDICTED: probable 39S ribosomal protein L49, mitochondrial [Dufourea novaeangliae]|uniref:Large ribosomal subunit protein mL49 n=1 Tax=Dufourea novaeangliae TaxID=178035 RepID=A0A154PRG1_DUFNO|nr:PREDICTED: probable 39S ribosomal protein L49, mitochondrial [Dufourea novaeangliae]KZC14481.1 putative 39S ribosomal protein L49, mitochondrial [Dufourea novaeangliae]